MSQSRVHELTNVELDQHLKRYGKYAATTRSKDQVNADCRGKITVVNMQNSNEGSGTHWCLLYDVRPHEVIWFDSMGAAPPRKVLSFMKSTGKTIRYNPDQLQALGSVVCGYWCEVVAGLLWNGYSLREIIDEYKKQSPSVNDRQIMKKNK
jgi:hypothetical protein